MIYDRTCVGDFPKPGASGRDRWMGDRLMKRAGAALEHAPWPGLSLSWQVGGALYSALGRLDARKGCASWGEALGWLADYPAPDGIAEIQFWGHGKWGCAMIDGDRLDLEALEPEHQYSPALRAIRQRMSGATGQPLWWFRTCETFGADSGHEFARRWTEFFDCRAAGHTYVIGAYQSGLHTLVPGETPNWSTEEGLSEGTPEEPLAGLWSTRREPNTITCFHGAIPAGY